MLDFIKKNVKKILENSIAPSFFIKLATRWQHNKFIKEKLNLPSIKNNSLKFNQIKDELQKNGICIIEGYWDEEKCKLVRNEIDRIIINHPEFIHPTAKSDLRIFGAEKLSMPIADFTNDTLLGNLATFYYSAVSRPAFTLAAKMIYKKGNLGSGEGWHRDAFFCQFKTIIYLSDVNKDNGPFQFIKNSFRLDSILSDIDIGKLGYMQNRIRDDQITSILEKNQERLSTFLGKAGTLIIVDTSAIHRGMPMNAGNRYALTNYYYPESKINKTVYENFAPVAGIIDKNKIFLNRIDQKN